MRVIENQYIINRKVIMLKTGHSLGSLAEHVGHTKQAVSQAIQGRSTSLRIHRKIAEVLNVRLVDFWPELYGDVEQKNFHDSPIEATEQTVN